ncbi:MAG: hypothetical protein NTY30_03965 [Candidatus Berkelbacteria bacterium]|nr:hypothetical protein [Candidatus Berkelbacteria bacterium]
MKRKKITQKERRTIVESVVGNVPWEQFTPGIYNNCDRWCERCSKTEKCYLFFEEKKEENRRTKRKKAKRYRWIT